MNHDIIFYSESPDETQAIGEKIAEYLTFPCCVYLNAEMGAGKTTLAKSIINAFGYQGAVTSPTYNLIQEYPVDQGIIYHMDLYRLEDPAELEYLATSDLWAKDSIFLIEWPEQAEGMLIPANTEISIRKKPDKGDFYREFVLKKMPCT